MMNDKPEWQKILGGDAETGAPARKLLGCLAKGQCFCTGRCKRTAEEQARHEEWQARHQRLDVKIPIEGQQGIGRQEFEPKPGHGSAPDAAAPSWEYPGQFDPAPAAPSALDTQVGGDHYKNMGEFQPWNVLKAWLTPEEFRGYMKGTAIAYLARERDKGGDQDVQKAAHTLQGLVEMLGAK